MISVDGQKVLFHFYRPGANRVCVAGDFNGWKIWDLDMESDGQGNWSLECMLPPGEYRFRYCADGEWYADYAASGVEPGRFGLDSLVHISESTYQSDIPAEAPKLYGDSDNVYLA